MNPILIFSGEETKTLLCEGTAELKIDETSFEGSGQVWFELLPRPHIYHLGIFKDESHSVAAPLIFNPQAILKYLFNKCEVEGFQISGRCELGSEKTIVKWQPSKETFLGLGGDATQLSEVVFHLFNFAKIIGPRRHREQRGNLTKAIECVSLQSDFWKVDIESLFETDDRLKKLKEEGGHRLTHTGSIKRSDGTTFSGKEVNDVITMLKFFLSFAKGGWSEPICAVGYDANSNRAWESYNSPHESWINPYSWFDPHNSQQLTDLWKGFTARWANEDWREALVEVIYWYLNSNNTSRGIDAGIILTQTAIERLSYEFAVKEKRLVEIQGFQDLRASDKFRLLFSSLGISLDIPGEAPELQKHAKKFNWVDAPHALTEVRNSLVHPENKRRGHLDKVFYEAWNLGLWYLEMGILAICNYSGTYGNRLKTTRSLGTVEKVPYNT